MKIISMLIEMEYVKSKSEFLRLIKQGGIQLNGEKISEINLDNIIKSEDTLKIGKKRFVKFRVSQ